MASLETLLISAVENNGATVDLSFAETNDGTCWKGGAADTPAAGYGASQILCECDGRENAESPCDKLELTGLTLNKTGGYELPPLSR